MEWWVVLILVGVGILGALIALTLIVRAFNGKKKFKFEIPKLDESEVEEIKNETLESSEPDEFEGLSFDAPIPPPVPHPEISDFNPFDFEDDFDEEEERNYRRFMRGETRAKKQLTPEEEFEKFRREHCYSKFVTDSELAKALKNAPREVRDLILNDLLKSLNLKDYDDIKL